MSLRATTLLIVIIIFIGLVVLLVFNLQTNLSSHFARLEKQSATLMVERARGVFDLEMESLNLIAQDWSKHPDVIAYFKSNTAQKPVLLSNECNSNNPVTLAILVDPQERVSKMESCQGASILREGDPFNKTGLSFRFFESFKWTADPICRTHRDDSRICICRTAGQ